MQAFEELHSEIRASSTPVKRRRLVLLKEASEVGEARVSALCYASRQLCTIQDRKR